MEIVVMAGSRCLSRQTPSSCTRGPATAAQALGVLRQLGFHYTSSPSFHQYSESTMLSCISFFLSTLIVFAYECRVADNQNNLDLQICIDQTRTLRLRSFLALTQNRICLLADLCNWSDSGNALDTPFSSQLLSSIMTTATQPYSGSRRNLYQHSILAQPIVKYLG